MHVAITGGTTGIGAKVVSKLKNQGHQVTVFDFIEITQSVDDFVHLDLSDNTSIEEALKNTNGPFDALINNAGIPPRENTEQKILMVNYIGMKTFLDGMIGKLNRGASIVNTSSRAGALWQAPRTQVKRVRHRGVAG